MKTLCVAVVAVLLAGLGSVQAQVKTLLTQEPMYGGADRNLVLQLKIDDERMVREVTKLYGTRQQASAALVANGFSYYQKDDLVNAMYRFNQAWTVDDTNPEVYVGFAAVLNDRRRHCEAMAMMDIALARNPAATRGIYPDAARAVASCALTAVERPAVDRQLLKERADAVL